MKKSLGAKTLLYPTPVLVVGSYDAKGRPNVMTAAWGGIACSQPPCVSVSLRAATASHGNIVARKAFTISLPSRKQAAQADYFGLVSGRDTDKFAATGLTPVPAEFVMPPMWESSPSSLSARSDRPTSSACTPSSSARSRTSRSTRAVWIATATSTLPGSTRSLSHPRPLATSPWVRSSARRIHWARRSSSRHTRERRMSGG